MEGETTLDTAVVEETTVEFVDDEEVAGEKVEEPSDTAEQKVVTFDDFSLDPRIIRAIAKQSFTVPTLIQEKAIPLIIDGKDVLARAKTGSGKTAAYLIPIIQSILKKRDAEPLNKACRALILVPTKELAEQVFKVIEKLTIYCGKLVRAVNLPTNVAEQAQRPQLLDLPDIIVSTPSRALVYIKSGALQITEALSHLVVDEADLVLSYGHEEDVQALSLLVPKGVQTMLMSATLSKDVESLKGLICRNPVVLKLHEGEEEQAALVQYYVKCAEDEKFLLSYVILKLKLIKGKIIIFVNNIDRCYRVKLFLEQFGIKSCVLNSELPVNSRTHIVDEFNKGVYDIIIAADDSDAMGELDSDDEQPKTKAKVVSKEEELNESVRPSKKRKRGHKADKEFGVSRGVDFRDVACVLNFDLPTTTRSYVHRAGRTARAGKGGMVMSFAIPTELHGKHKATSLETTKRDEHVLKKIEKDQKSRGNQIQPYQFNMTQVEAFRYRMQDALRAVTKVSIREARAKELRHEIIASEKLKKYFEENPQELAQLRHDSELHANRVQPHLKHVPDYLMPKKGGGSGVTQNGSVGFVGFKRTSENRIRKARAANRSKGKRPKRGDPLKSLKSK